MVDLRIAVERPALQIFGYHGTTANAARSILATGFRIGKKGWDWLGDGAYFWQDAPQRALEWARLWHIGRGRKEEPLAVIRSQIALEDCLDLLDNEANELLRDAPANFLAKLPEESKATLVNGVTKTGESRYGCNRLDCAFFNHLVEVVAADSGTKIRCVRAAVAEGERILASSPICFDSHVQVAVRDPALIGETVVIYSEEDEDCAD